MSENMFVALTSLTILAWLTFVVYAMLRSEITSFAAREWRIRPIATIGRKPGDVKIIRYEVQAKRLWVWVTDASFESIAEAEIHVDSASRREVVLPEIRQ